MRKSTRRSILAGAAAFAVAAPYIVQKARTVFSNPRGNSISDPLLLNQQTFPINNDINGLTQVSPVLGAGRTVVLVVIGDSISSNSLSFDNPSPTIYQIQNPDVVQQLNVYSGAIYKTTNDPALIGMVGTTGNRSFGVPVSSFMRQVADQLIINGKAARVIIAQVAVGGTTTGDWAQGGVTLPFPGAALPIAYPIIPVIGRRIAELGLNSATVLTLINLGLNDCGYDQDFGYTLMNSYASNMAIIMSTVQSYGMGSAVFLSKATWARGSLLQGSNIQISVTDGLVNNSTVFQGSNLNNLGLSFRQDGVHFNFNTGLPAQAGLTYTPLAAYLDNH